jgi:dihydrofolate synthase / folylpolyglutamate synthase
MTILQQYYKQQYKSTLDYMFSQLPMYQRVGAAAFKKDLDNTLALCAAVGNPQTKFKSIHVGGTNGKGSVSHLLAAMFQASGLKVGLYVSPHYKDFRERIKINGKYISKQFVVDFVAQQKANFETIQPSFFEMTVAMAFSYFADQKVDIAIIEVGLGGRLDSTNIIDPLMSVITNISLDHTNMLGETLPEIAFEKAGIIKKNTPIVVGERQIEVEQVFINKAAEMGSNLIFASDMLPKWTFGYQKLSFINHFSERYGLELWTAPILPNYQLNNIRTALVAIDVYNSKYPLYKIYDSSIRTAIRDLQGLTKFMGRWQQLQTSPLIIADSAHNEAGVQLVVSQINQLTFNKLHIVIGTVNDKDIRSILKFYPKNATYYFAKANIPRGLDAKILKQQANEIGLKGRAYTSVKNAFRAAKQKAKPDDLIVVMGSIFVVAEVI